MNLHRTIVGISALLAIHSAQAGPPFVTDDPEPPPPGGWEINVPFILERSAGNAEMNAPLFDFNYGLPDVQLKLEFPVAIVAQCRAQERNFPRLELLPKPLNPLSSDRVSHPPLVAGG
jgi:hypothetical protein